MIPEDEQPVDGAQPNGAPPNAAQPERAGGGGGGDAVAQDGILPAAGEGGGEGEGGGAADDTSSGGGLGGELAVLEEDVDALEERVGEMEKMVARGTAPQLQAIIAGRLKSLDERLTLHMLAIDRFDAGEADRPAKRGLTRRMDTLCSQLANVLVKFGDGGT